MRSIVRLILLLTMVLLLWQGLVDYWQIPDYLLPSPWQILQTFIEEWRLIAREAIPTLYETLLGLVLGVSFGCLAGILVAFFQPARRLILPLLIVSQAIPTFVIAPLLVIWLGFGAASKIATTMLMIFFPITSAFYDGLRTTPVEWLHLAKTMNASSWRIFWHIRIPAALPKLAAGIRISAVVAPIGAIVGEWVGSSAGLGYLMLNANARMQIDLMFASLIVIIILALTLYFSIDKLLRTWITW